MTNKKTVLSGVQPSGQLSIGNYLGALKNFNSMQETRNALYCIVDLHAITVRQEPQTLRENTYAVAAWYLASGLDPEKCTLFVQSHVPQHAELAWLLATFTQMGELERMTQFKDKAQRHKQNINAGLFSYPTLMAADILLYDADEVPVGDDQKQHLELTRDVAMRVNNAYGEELLVVPEPVIPKIAARIKDLQHPEKKMSKSDDGAGTVFMADEPGVMLKKVKRAVTDNEANIVYDEQKQPGVANLLGIYAACRDITIEEAVQHFHNQQYGALKTNVGDTLVETMTPIQERYSALMNDKDMLDDILARGAQKASQRAEKTLSRVKEAIGLVPLSH